MALISLQSAASGLSALNTSMDVISNNLANVNTAGFKASRANFQDLLYLEREQPGVENASGDQRPIGTYVGLGVRVAGTQIDFEQGSRVKEQNTDAAIQGLGFFRVIVPDAVSGDGIAYTRAGQFTRNSEGQLVLASDPGRRLADDITIPPDASEISIDTSGRVFVRQPGNLTPVEVGQIQTSVFVNPTGLQPVGENLFVETEASGPAITGEPGTDSRGQILGGYYEASNVDPTRELIELIRVQRAFEMNTNTIRAADEALRTVSQLRR